MQPFRVLFINPSSDRFYIPSAPLGLAYLAGALPDGVETEGLDLNVLKWIHGLDGNGIEAAFDRYLNRSLQHHVAPDLIGITVYEETLPQTERILEIAERYGIPTVAGGIFPTMFPEELPEAPNWIVRGEGELPFRQLVQALMRGINDVTDSIRAIPGISYRDTQGVWQHKELSVGNGMGKEFRPRRDIFNALNMGFRYYSARIVSSSGCPYGCKFCANSEYARREWIPRPVEDVIKEIQELLCDESISEISFSDDQFLGFKPEHYRRARLLLESIETMTRRRNLRINLQVRADRYLEALEVEPGLAEVILKINRNFVDPSAETSELVHGRPVRGFALDIGIESFLDRRLQAMGKGINAEENRKAVRKARELGVDLGVYMLTFTPDITLEELRQEYAHFYQEVIASDAFSKSAFFGFFQELIPYRGTTVYKELAESGELVENGAVAGFQFKDPGVAAFYLQYLYGIRSTGIGAAKSKGEILAWIERIFTLSAEVSEHPAAVNLVTKVICELKDDQVLEQLYDELGKIMA